MSLDWPDEPDEGLSDPRPPEGCQVEGPDGKMIKLTPVYDGMQGDDHRWLLTGAEGKLPVDRFPNIHIDMLPEKTVVSILVGIEDDQDN